MKKVFRIVEGGERAPEETGPESGRAYALLADRGSRAEDCRLSKFGGLPYWPATEPWPTCLACGQPQMFVCQVRADAAHRLFGGASRFLSFFYCFSCKPWWGLDNSRSWLGFVDISPAIQLLPVKKTPLFASAPEPVAVRQGALDDFPSVQDLPEFAELSPAQRVVYGEERPTHAGSKLGGFPAWVGKPDVPRCPDCDRPMIFAGQLSSGEFHGFSWGEDGRVFFFRCEACVPERWGFLIQGD